MSTPFTETSPAPSPDAIGIGGPPPLFGWYHGPSSPARSCAVVLCYPLHYEAICSHRAYRKLALLLASEGFPTLRFDYAGTGDSFGSDAEPGRVRAWIDSVHAAVAEARRLSGAESVALVGVRIGALLALAAAGREEGIDAVVLWAPVTGRDYVREVKAFNAARPGVRAIPGEPEAGEEYAGFLLTRETMADLVALEVTDAGRRPAQCALYLDRDDIPGGSKIEARLAATGMPIERRTVAGYASMMAYPHLSVVPDEAWKVVTEFLSRRHPRDNPRLSTRVKALVRFTSHTSAGTTELREEAVTFDRGRLFGILGEPGAGAPAPSRPTCALLLTMASHHRIGPNRLHTRWARELGAMGYATLRFDISGTGDSESNHTGLENAPASVDQARDLSLAMDFLESRGYTRFVGVGICSGAYYAFHASLEDRRLTSNVLVNPQRFEEEDGSVQQAGGTRTAEFKSTSAYRRLLFSPQTWRRLIHGEVQMVRIVLEMTRRFRSRVRALGKPKTILHSFRGLAARGVHSLFVFASEDVNIDYVEQQLGQGASRVGDSERVRVLVVEGAEHTFGQMWAQKRLGEILSEHLRAHVP